MHASPGPGSARPPVFDGHNDSLLSSWRTGRDLLARSEDGHIDVPRAREGGLAAGLFAVFVPEEGEPVHPAQWVKETADGGWAADDRPAIGRERASSVAGELIALLFRLEAASEGALAVVRDVEGLERCLAGEALGAVLHLEGAEPIDPELRALEPLFELGMRSLGPVWSRPNDFGEGVPFRFPASPDTGPGLTAAGRNLVGACNELGILVDLSHLNEAGFREVAGLSDAPLVASHSGAHAVCASTRNLTDAQLDAIGDSGGIVGVVFDVTITTGRYDAATPLDAILGHVDHIAGRIGIDHVGIGSDFDGCLPPSALGDVTGLPKLLDALAARGYGGEALAKIAHGNWLRVLRNTWH
jgi:membrane dipeptidase